MRSRRPASNVGPCPARTGCTRNPYSSVSPRSANARGSVTPPTSHVAALPSCARRVHRTVLQQLPAPFSIGAPIANILTQPAFMDAAAVTRCRTFCDAGQLVLLSGQAILSTQYGVCTTLAWMTGVARVSPGRTSMLTGPVTVSEFVT